MKYDGFIIFQGTLGTIPAMIVVSLASPRVHDVMSLSSELNDQRDVRKSRIPTIQYYLLQHGVLHSVAIAVLVNHFFINMNNFSFI